MTKTILRGAVLSVPGVKSVDIEDVGPGQVLVVLHYAWWTWLIWGKRREIWEEVVDRVEEVRPICVEIGVK